MTTITYSLDNRVTFDTPRGRVTATAIQARGIAARASLQHELEEAMQNPDIPVPVSE